MLPVIYFDANATEPLRPQARDAMLQAATLCGNPSSVHQAGRQARKLLDDARKRIARHFDTEDDNCVFTSGGTEACALAIHGLQQENGPRRVIIGATEHDAVRQACAETTILPVDANGQINPDDLERTLAEDQSPALVCLMLANNETGVLHPVAEAGRICAQYGALLHIDAVQAAGRVPVSVTSPGVTSLAISGHKFGGPKGAGALLLAGGGARQLAPLFAGGGQERGRRGGTPALPAIYAMAAALDAAIADQEQRTQQQTRFRNRIDGAAKASGSVVIGENSPRLPNTTSLATPGIRAEARLITMDMAGICISSGSACSSGKIGRRSHVLEAMNTGELADCTVRVSLPWNVTEDEVTQFISIWARPAR